MTASAASQRGDSATPGDGRIQDSSVLLVGRPNSGKSSLYNLLTGGHARVGNFPGVTVDILEARIALGAEEPGLRIVDLPGVYSLEGEFDPDSDEGHCRAFVDGAEAAEAPLVIAQVADANQLALGLRLTVELARRKAPLALIVTQIDVLQKEGRLLDINVLERELGIPVIAVTAIDSKTGPRLLRFLSEAVSQAQRAPLEENLDPHALAHDAISDRHDADAVERRRRDRTQRIDAVLLHPVIGPVVFLAIMTALCAAVFLVADPVTTLIDAANRALGGVVEGVLGQSLFTSLLTDGVLGGAGTVLAFLPQIVILTVVMEIIDASGYLSRGSFLVDRILRAAGLGGRSFVPLLTAHACAVPAIQATRAIRDPGQRLRTILVLPLMTCSARIPTYGLLIATFFALRGVLFKGALFVGLYFAGILSGLVASLVVGRAVKRTSRSLPLVLEMPSYRLPRPSVVGRVAWRTCVRFLSDVGTVILVASMVLWVLLTVPGPREKKATSAPPGASVRVERMHRSLAAFVGREIEPVTRAAGFDWRINVGLMGSLGARELMVSTLGVIFGIESDGADNAATIGPLADRIRSARGADGRPAYGVATGLALMAFFVIACQCMSTLAAIRRETRSLRWPAFVLIYTYVVAFALAVLVYRGANLLGL